VKTKQKKTSIVTLNFGGRNKEKHLLLKLTGGKKILEKIPVQERKKRKHLHLRRRGKKQNKILSFIFLWGKKKGKKKRITRGGRELTKSKKKNTYNPFLINTWRREKKGKERINTTFSEKKKKSEHYLSLQYLSLIGND